MTDTPVHDARPGLPDGPIANRLADLIFTPIWALLVGVAVAVLVFGAPPQRLQWIPLVASAVVLGLPHGAVDHLALPRLYGEGLTRRWIAVVVGLYAAIGGAYALLWFVLPSAAFLLFIVITWLHWGQGDVYPLVELADVDHLQSSPERALTVLVRGGFPMLVPLLAFPEQYRLVAERIVAVFASAPGASIDFLFQPTVRLGLGTGFFTLVGLSLAVGFFRAGESGRRGWLLDLTEVTVLTLLFVSVPPILAVGLYFCFWHALRHVARLVALDDRAVRALDAGSWSGAALRFVRDAAPLTAVSIAMLGLAYVLVPTAPGTVPDLVALYLVLIAVLTLPHVVVVTWMDSVQGIFGESKSSE